MRAERDEDDHRPVARKRERRLAYEIAIGVLIAQILFWPIERIADGLYAKWQLGLVKVELERWERNGYKGIPFEK
jgi:hypothetical protein